MLFTGGACYEWIEDEAEEDNEVVEDEDVVMDEDDEENIEEATAITLRCVHSTSLVGSACLTTCSAMRKSPTLAITLSSRAMATLTALSLMKRTKMLS